MNSVILFVISSLEVISNTQTVESPFDSSLGNDNSAMAQGNYGMHFEHTIKLVIDNLSI